MHCYQVTSIHESRSNGFAIASAVDSPSINEGHWPNPGCPDMWPPKRRNAA